MAKLYFTKIHQKLCKFISFCIFVFTSLIDIKSIFLFLFFVFTAIQINKMPFCSLLLDVQIICFSLTFPWRKGQAYMSSSTLKHNFLAS